MDESTLKNLEGLPAEDQMRMANMIEQLQLRDRLSRYWETNMRADRIASIYLDNQCQELQIENLSDELRSIIHQVENYILRMYNAVVERCFTDCVDSFRRKSLDKGEETCVRRCTEKFLKHSMRVGLRFAELNQGAATQD